MGLFGCKHQWGSWFWSGTNWCRTCSKCNRIDNWVDAKPVKRKVYSKELKMMVTDCYAKQHPPIVSQWEGEPSRNVLCDRFKGDRCCYNGVDYHVWLNQIVDYGGCPKELV